MTAILLRASLFVSAVSIIILIPTRAIIAADAYPNKPVLFITHSGPGGGMDTMLRRITDIMAKEKLVSQQMRVENIQGGSGAKAMTTLVKRKGDDHVLAGMTSVWVAAPLISSDVKVSYKDMTPLLCSDWILILSWCARTRPSKP
jgi:putative tricarboxylic transport membrane protein